ncbi:MAG: diguanylate cyclase domain-containing protein [Nanobdellota archaeon]
MGDSFEREKELENKIKDLESELEQRDVLNSKLNNENEILKYEKDVYQDIVHQSNSIIIKFDRDGKITFANDFATSLFGYSKEELNQGNIFESDATYSLKKEHGLESMINYIINNNLSYASDENEILTKNNDLVSVSWTNSGIYDANGNISGVVCVGRDITKQKSYERALRERQKYMEAVFYNSPSAIITLDSRHGVKEMNTQAEKMFGYSIDEVKGIDLDELISCEYEIDDAKKKTKVLLSGGVVPQEESIRYDKQGKPIPVLLSGSSIVIDDTLIGAVVVYTDITKQKQMEEELRMIGFHDPLTGVYSRYFFEEEVKRLENSRDSPISVFYCDIDNFKHVNDFYGHDKGDELLKSTADILKRSFRQNDIIARMGGDEFCVILPKCDKLCMHSCNSRIKENLNYYNAENPGLPLDLSVGYSVQYQYPVNIDELMKKADQEMYKQKWDKKVNYLV